MVSKGLTDLSPVKQWAAILGIMAALGVPPFAVLSYAAGQKLAENFTTVEKMEAHEKKEDARYSELSSIANSNVKAIDNLTKITTSTQITQLTFQISTIESTLAEMLDNEKNWKPYEAGIYREKKNLLETLKKRLADMQEMAQ